MIGLGTMGRNFLLNVSEHGFSCAGYDLDEAKRTLLLADGQNLPIETGASLDEFLAKLDSPRKIMLLVPAQVVDVVINDLIPKLEKGDIIIDGGNSHFPDTERREILLNENGFDFLGVGVSGGEEGARHGASIMPGGKKEVYEKVRAIFESASARVNGEPCVAYIGKNSAGHFVKMVHNGIEYGLMQLIAETFDLMQRALGMSSEEIAKVFEEWNRGELNSFLIEITSIVLRKCDEKTGKPLVEMILDTAGQKGTGKWTSQVALDFGVPVPTIDSAVTMRQLSAMKTQRVSFSGKFKQAGQDEQDGRNVSENLSVEVLKEALIASFVLTYAQGFSLLAAASVEKNYELDLKEITRIWRGGCIIRAALLEDFRKVFAKDSSLTSILFDENIVLMLKNRIDGLRKVSAYSAANGFPSYCLMSSLAFFDALKSVRLPANLIQAQRDYFGAHTYQRTDQAGTFHTPGWNS